ncbi:thiamine phosphate synthase [Brucella pseudogrignonensis]|jgi:thiamine-phosphate pyrophosphorylase|uniref:thiamine phosphate synthase n=1 Tax=Brucella TaxID=234 RepID=UPI0007DAA282|nr:MULTISPECIES: thiamine phosphate synthase [Brucella]MBK0023364.1 thiamine phosphate synthase [Ochrobactrum sp. S45]MBK0045266.1 thiamine phosphate synthase [Ochrobactrum sp. S46]MBO1026172.1 thiamine phosphate synthase [Ochrobactrum sp. SD129]MQP42331.1 thiamine phosphate synthase [Ochrobactrum sp. MYb237]ANG96559.1 thiamine phosphate synthase [Brucella pseudogrignonensis]
MNTPNTSQENERCRLLLVAPPLADGDALAKLLSAALSGGDVASVILDGGDLDEAAFQASAQKAVSVIQENGAAAIILNDTRIAGRVGADGIHIEGKASELAEAIEKHTPKFIVGTGNLRDRHGAMEIGELQPDYVFFGKIGADNKPDAHPRNLALAEWWAEMVEIPSIAQAGNTIESVVEAAQTGADFVALGRAVFEAEDPAKAVAEANRLLDENAPRFEN